MTVCLAWAEDEALLDAGLTITDPGPGLPRTAVRGHLVFVLEPRCLCEWCPESDHPNYRPLEAA